MGMNSGYSGWSRSKRAAQAEREGKRPASRLAKDLRPLFPGITSGDVQAVMDPCEWHHTSKMANATDYYDPADVMPDHERHTENCDHPADQSCEDCEGAKEDARDLAEELRVFIAKRKLLAKLIRKHGANGRFPVRLLDGTLWHTVSPHEVRNLGRVLVTLNCGGCREDFTTQERLEAEELRRALTE